MSAEVLIVVHLLDQNWQIARLGTSVDKCGARCVYAGDVVE